ncbi:MAG: hypothetical protein ACLVIP_04430 [Ruminococcus sp.]
MSWQKSVKMLCGVTVKYFGVLLCLYTGLRIGERYALGNGRILTL